MTPLSEIALQVFKKRYTQLTPQQQEYCREIRNKNTNQ
jgi:Lhr-like helicase